MARWRLLERTAIVAAVLLLVALPTALHGWPTTPRGVLFTGLLVAGGGALAWWRDDPRSSSAASLGLLLAAACVGGWFPDPAIVLYVGAFAVLGLAWGGRAAWVAAALGAGYVVVLGLVAMPDLVPALMISVPPYIAGTVLRLRQETTRRLAATARELDEERELYAAIALRHERARIAGELHDIVGHAVSVMVIQAAAGRRLLDSDVPAAREAFAAITESAREGQQDLARLVELLGRGPADAHGAVDLALVEEVARRAARSGLRVTCRLEGDPTGVPDPVARLAFRVVQESLTNALRYAPGAEVRITVRAGEADGLLVRVENGDGVGSPPQRLGSGRGLLGLRERVQALGGGFTAGAAGEGGWVVETRLPAR